MRILEYTIRPEEAGRTVRVVALKGMKLSRSGFSSLKFQNAVFLDGAPVHADVRVAAGQVLSVRLTDAGQTVVPYAMPLSVPYADDDLFILDKPAPLPTLCSARQAGPTLENALYAFLGCPADYVFRPVNRLDKGTSGLLAAARNAHIQQLLQKQLHTPDFVREYLAVCEGRPEKDAGVIDLPIARAGDGARRTVRPDGLPSRTHYQVIKEGKNGRCLVRLRLETGRTHQIRVHLAAMGCPVTGDYLYGHAEPALPGRFALHSCLLRLRHPLTGETLQAESPLPEALSALLRAEKT